MRQDGSNIFHGKFANYFGKNFETHFRDQLLFIDGATLFRNPAEEMNKVQDFLNIGRELKTKNFVKE